MINISIKDGRPEIKIQNNKMSRKELLLLLYHLKSGDFGTLLSSKVETLIDENTMNNINSALTVLLNMRAGINAVKLENAELEKYKMPIISNIEG